MSKKPETKFSNRVKEDLERLPNTWVEKIQQVAIRGTPDFILCVNGTFIGLELKKDKHAPMSGLQKHKLANIADAGGIPLLAYPENWEEIYTFLAVIAHQKKGMK